VLWDTHIKKAHSAFAMKNLHETLSLCDLSYLDPERPVDQLWSSYIRQARICFAGKNIGQAVRMCQLALQQAAAFGDNDWRMFETERLSCRVLMHLKEYDKAEAILSSMLVPLHDKYGGTSPEFFDVALTLAQIYELRGDYARAIKLVLHVMFNHPRRVSDPVDQEYAAIKRKYHALKKIEKHTGVTRRIA